MALAALILRCVLHAYGLLLLAYAILSWVRPSANRWTVMIAHLVEPVLNPVRRVLRLILPARVWILDWSPMALYLLILIACRLLRLVR